MRYIYFYLIMIVLPTGIISNNNIRTRKNLKSINKLIVLEKAYYNRGLFYKKKFDYLIAINFFDKCIRLSKKINGKNLGNSYIQLSKIFYNINNKTLTNKFLSKALAYSKLNKNILLKSKIYFFYSQNYYDKKNYKNALKYILKAELLLNENSYKNKKQVLFLKAKILYKLNDINTASIILKNLIKNRLDKKLYINSLNILYYYTDILIERNNFYDAKKIIMKIDDIYAPYFKFYFYYYYLKGRLYEKNKQNKKALMYYNKTINNIFKLYNISSYKSLSSLREDIDNIYNKISFFLLNLNDKKYVKKFLYLNELNVFSNKNKILNNKITASKLYELKNFINNQKIGLSKAETSNEIKKLQNNFKFKYEVHKYNKLCIENIQKKLTKSQLIIKYIIIENNLYTIYISKNNFKLIKSLNIIHKLNLLITSLSEPLDDFSRGKVDYLRVKFNTIIATKLYDILLKKTLIENPKIKELIIIPNGILFKIPFESLITGFKNNQTFFTKYQKFNYLIEKYSVSYNFSLFQFLNRSKKKYYKKKYQLSFFGNPVISKKVLHLLSPLPSTINELNSIKNVFNKKEIIFFTKNNFNIFNFKKFSPQSEIIHIATHYVNNNKEPFFSFLLLSENKKTSKLCYAHDIYNYKLNNLLTVLSVCESAGKNFIGTTGMNGILTAFKNAGTKTIIVSLWPVDQFNSTILPVFYKYLNKYNNYSQKNISSALRLAKIDYIKKTKFLKSKLKISFSHPFLWSNFVIYNLN